MQKILRSIPLPVSAIALSFATLGNILSNVGVIRPIFGTIAALLLVIILLKIALTPAKFKEDMLAPVVASTFATFSMAIMVLSTYVKPVSRALGLLLWCVGIAIHIAIIVYVFTKFVLPSRKIFPSYYVTFVGIAVASVTSPAFALQRVGFVIAIIAALFFLLITPPILRNVFKANYLPAPANPTKTIVAAPMSLIITGYVNSAAQVNQPLLLVMLIIAVILTALGIYFIATTIKKEFNPAYAAYTFPMVISCFAAKVSSAAIETPAIKSVLGALHSVELLIALLAVAFALAMYIKNFCEKATIK